MRGVKRAMQVQREQGCQGAQIAGCHMEGPFINDAKRGAQDPNGILRPSAETYEQIVGEPGDIVRLMTIAPEIEGARELCLYVRPNVRLAVGHSIATAEQVEQGGELGLLADNAYVQRHERAAPSRTGRGPVRRWPTTTTRCN